MNRSIISLMLIFILVSTSIVFSQISFTEHTIRNNFNTAWYAYPADMDGDGDLDVLGTARFGNRICWWENDGKQNFTEHIISNSVNLPMRVVGVDVDSDGDMDVVCGIDQDNIIAWWENDGNLDFTMHIIGNWSGTNYIDAIDLDEDGDMDVLAAACEGRSNEFGWFKNDGNQHFMPRLVKADWIQPNSIYAKDLDLDGDLDLLGTASYREAGRNGEIAWFENDGSENFTEHTILDSWGRPNSVYADDVDRDGDIDILAVSCFMVHEVAWFENDGQQNYTKRTIARNFTRPHSIYTADFDNDGDVDVIATAIEAHQVAWWENDGSQNFTKHLISDSFNGATTAYPVDLDKDGDIDVLGAAQYANRISWWENNLYKMSFRAEPTSGHAPLTVHFYDESSAPEPLISWAWDFDNDGVVDSQQQNPTWTYENNGIYTVRLDVSNSTVSRTIVYRDYIRVVSSQCALQFNGETSYVTVPASPSLNVTNQFSLEAWIKPTGWGEAGNLGYGRILDKQVIMLYLINSSLTYNDHSLAIQLVHDNYTNSFTTTPDNSITLDTWQHIAVTYDGNNSEVSVYINGVMQTLMQRVSPTGNIQNHEMFELVIGNNATQNLTFDGLIDEVRIWNRLLTAQEISSHQDVYLEGVQENLVAYWQMDEGTGDTIQDLSGNENNGIIIGALWADGVNLSSPVLVYTTKKQMPDVFKLYDNYPNPFNQETMIQFQVPYSAHVIIEIYDLSGRLLTTLIDEVKTAGFHRVAWNGCDHAGLNVVSGVYFYRFIADDFRQVRKLTLLK